MLTLILILVAAVLVAGFVFLTGRLLAGDGCALVWYLCGGAGQLAELIGAVFLAIVRVNRSE